MGKEKLSEQTSACSAFCRSLSRCRLWLLCFPITWCCSLQKCSLRPLIRLTLLSWPLEKEVTGPVVYGGKQVSSGRTGHLSHHLFENPKASLGGFTRQSRGEAGRHVFCEVVEHPVLCPFWVPCCLQRVLAGTSPAGQLSIPCLWAAWAQQRGWVTGTSWDVCWGKPGLSPADVLPGEGGFSSSCSSWGRGFHLLVFYPGKRWRFGH